MKGRLSNAQPRTCLVCDEDFIPVRAKQWFCSPPKKCRQTNKAKSLIRQMAAERGATLEPRACEKCGTTFTPRATDQKTCGAQCPGPRAITKTCAAPDCGNQFTIERVGARGVGQGNRRFCSASCRDRHSTWRLAQRFRKYKITKEAYQALVSAQGNRCAICRALPSPVPFQMHRDIEWHLAVDHDHATGARRDLLCHKCNMGLGMFNDDPAVLRAAADYIERHRTQSEA